MNALSALLHSRKRRIIAVCSLILILFAAVCLYRACLSPLQEGISIGGVDVGGLTPVKARQALLAALEKTLLRQELPVHLPEETLTLSPEDCGVSVSLSRVLHDARRIRQDSPVKELSLMPYLKMDEGYIRSLLEDYATQYDTDLSQPHWHLEGEASSLSTEDLDPEAPCQTLVVTMGVPACHLYIPEILGNIRNAFSDSILLCRDGAYQVTPEVQPEALPDTPDAAAILAEFDLEPVNDSVNREDFSFVHGSYGLGFDAELLQQQIRQAAPGEVITLSLEYVAPDILGDEAYFQDVLGACETRHTNDQNRNTNLQIQCDALNGLVLQPGETFSMNGVLGERTEEKGYKPAPAYSGNRLVNDLGGGVCQGTTTLYNCVLLADLEVVFRVCHGVRVGYVPLGLDAAVNFLTTDFQFRNNFHFPIQLRAWMEDGYVKMQILGIDEKDYYIKMETGSGEDEYAYYARSYKCKYDKETNELLSRDIEAFSTYYKDIG